MKINALPLVPAIDLELTRAWPTDLELSDEDLEQVVGGLERVWLPPSEPGVPRAPEL